MVPVATARSEPDCSSSQNRSHPLCAGNLAHEATVHQTSVVYNHVAGYQPAGILLLPIGLKGPEQAGERPHKQIDFLVNFGQPGEQAHQGKWRAKHDCHY